MSLNEAEINPCKLLKALICRRVGTAIPVKVNIGPNQRLA